MLKPFLLAAFVVLSVAGCAAPVAQAPAQSTAPATAPATVAAAAPKTAAPTPAPAAPTTAATAAPKAGATTAVGGKLTVYSGRNEQLVAPIIDKFKQASGVDVQVRYGDTAQLAATILEEGNNSPADVFFAQDAGALGALSNRQRLTPLPDALLSKVDPRFRSPKGDWVGVSGRARVIVYNNKELKESDLPDSVLDLTDPKWQGKVGWAPTNASFQSFVTALRTTQGDAAATKWLKDMQANGVRAYANNPAILDAVAKGEIQVGLANHYYLYQQKAKLGDSYPVANYSPRGGDIGAMINVAGLGILPTVKNRPAAEALIAFLMSEEAQTYFANQTYEYPLAAGVKPGPTLKPLDQIQTPKLDLSSLADLEGTLKLLRDAGVLS